SSRRRHTRFSRDWSSDVCSSDLPADRILPVPPEELPQFILAVADNGMRILAIIAAPIVAVMFLAEAALALISRFAPQVQVFILRSEERRVGKECRSRWSPSERSN